MARFRLNRTQLYKNQTYDDALADLINATLPSWMENDHAYPQKMKRAKAHPKHKQRLFGRFYTNNFQLRSLAGCSGGECLDDDRLAATERERLRRQLPSSTASRDDAGVCTQYFVMPGHRLFDPCGKQHTDACPRGCAGPCFYATAATGTATRTHLARAASSLASFDAVLIAERWEEDDGRQSDFLADLAGVPRDAPFAPKNAGERNLRVEKAGARERRCFYRDLLRRLGLGHLLDALGRENALEVELYEHARHLNDVMLEAWENETSAMVPTIAAAFHVNEEQSPSGKRASFVDDASISKRAEEGDIMTAPAHDTDDAHRYGVIFVMYHKTGYVLSRFLAKEIIELEHKARGYAKKEVRVVLNSYAQDYVDKETGTTIAFGRRGGWKKMLVKPRTHHGLIGCDENFRLRAGKIHLQEAPDFYCSDADLSARMLGLPARFPHVGGRVKIVHFARNPFDMALSNYFYHSQEKVQEAWVQKDDPCDINYSNGESLASHVLPVLSPRTKITESQLDAVLHMCQSLFQRKHGLHNATFREHLVQLNPWDGLRLATAQMLISSSRDTGYLAGGDILRMANNIIKFRDLQTSPLIPITQRDNTHVLTFAMEQYLECRENVTTNLFNFVLSNDIIVSQALKIDASRDWANKQAKPLRNSGGHVTQGKHQDREQLRQALREDLVLGPILREVEILVNKALNQNRENVFQ